MLNTGETIKVLQQRARHSVRQQQPSQCQLSSWCPLTIWEKACQGEVPSARQVIPESLEAFLLLSDKDSNIDWLIDIFYKYIYIWRERENVITQGNNLSKSCPEIFKLCKGAGWTLLEPRINLTQVTCPTPSEKFFYDHLVSLIIITGTLVTIFK